MTHPARVAPTRDLVAEALDRAPSGKLLTAEQRAECDAILEEIRAGRAHVVRDEDVPAWLEEQARQEHGDG